MNNQSFSFIGGGNMAEALLKGFLAEGLLKASDITVCELVPERRNFLEDRYGVATTDSIAVAAAADSIMLAVKPQQFPEVLRKVRDALAEGSLVISIAAGISIAQIEAALPAGTRVVRVMPNTPALVGRGIAGYSAGRAATETDMAWTQQLLEAVGAGVRVEEDDLHAVTAVSGSGPAYVFYAMEAMTAAARGLGLSEQVAAQLVQQTFSGASKLAEVSDDSPAELRIKVTSKGGTTAAALAKFEELGLGAAWQEGVRSAAQRSRELAGE